MKKLFAVILVLIFILCSCEKSEEIQTTIPTSTPETAPKTAAGIATYDPISGPDHPVTLKNSIMVNRVEYFAKPEYAVKFDANQSSGSLASEKAIGLVKIGDNRAMWLTYDSAETFFPSALNCYYMSVENEHYRLEGSMSYRFGYADISSFYNMISSRKTFGTDIYKTGKGEYCDFGIYTQKEDIPDSREYTELTMSEDGKDYTFFVVCSVLQNDGLDDKGPYTPYIRENLNNEYWHPSQIIDQIDLINLDNGSTLWIYSYYNNFQTETDTVPVTALYITYAYKTKNDSIALTEDYINNIKSLNKSDENGLINILADYYIFGDFRLYKPGSVIPEGFESKALTCTDINSTEYSFILAYKSANPDSGENAEPTGPA